MMQWIVAAEDAAAGGTCAYGINWALLAVLLQILVLGYLVYGFMRVARNQTQLAEYLKEMFEKDKT